MGNRWDGSQRECLNGSDPFCHVGQGGVQGRGECGLDLEAAQSAGRSGDVSQDCPTRSGCDDLGISRFLGQQPKPTTTVGVSQEGGGGQTSWMQWTARCRRVEAGDQGDGDQASHPSSEGTGRSHCSQRGPMQQLVEAMKNKWRAGLLSGGHRGVDAPSGLGDGPAGSSPTRDETPADVWMASAGTLLGRMRRLLAVFER